MWEKHMTRTAIKSYSLWVQRCQKKSGEQGEMDIRKPLFLGKSMCAGIPSNNLITPTHQSQTWLTRANWESTDWFLQRAFLRQPAGFPNGQPMGHVEPTCSWVSNTWLHNVPSTAPRGSTRLRYTVQPVITVQWIKDKGIHIGLHVWLSSFKSG